MGSLYKNFRHFIAGHWRGKNDVWVTIVGSLIIIRLLYGFIQMSLLFHPSIVLIAILSLANLILLVWQVVGTWRASDIRIKSGGTMIEVWICYIAILAVVIWAIVQMLDGFLSRAPTKHEMMLKDYNPMELRLEGEIAYIEGELDYQQSTALINALEEDSSLKKVILKSDGGLIFAARALVQTITKYKLDTHIDDHCFSACTLVFLAGKNRTMHEEAKLGFHAYDLDTEFPIKSLNIAEEQKKDQTYMLQRGVAPYFVERVYTTSNSSIWVPTHDELRKAKILN